MRVLYLDIDSLRPDHLGCYGYHRPTSPRLDSLAREGVRFNNYFCADSPCVPSRAALFSGRPGIRSGIVTHETTPAGCQFRYDNPIRYGSAPTMAAVLGRAGVHTASISSFPDRHSAGWFTFGFRELHVPSLKGGDEDAPEVNATAVPWLQANASRDNWFLHLNYWEPHTLYTEPLSYLQEMAKHPAPAWPDANAIARQQRDVGFRSASMLWGDHAHDGFGKSRVPTMPDTLTDRAGFEHLINGYDGAIRYLDDQLEEIFDQLKRQGVWDQTAIIVSADHAEAFGEMGQYMEHGSVSTSVHRIPLIVRWPGVTDRCAGQSRDDHLLNTDFAPTMAELLSAKAPAGWPGRSFAPLLRDAAPPDRRELVWTHGLHTRQRAVYDGQWLFVRTYDPGFHLYAPRMLYDLSTDPHEQFDVSADHPQRVAAMDASLLDWERRQVSATGLPDPLRQAVDQPPKPQAQIDAVLARLKKLGRDDDARKLRDVLARRNTDYAPQPL